jgi:hypothetical protein
LLAIEVWEYVQGAELIQNKLN